MARLNIEDSLFKDPRFMELAIKLGDRHRALGAVVEAFMVAQEFYLNLASKHMIPLNEWKRRKLTDAIIDCGLAELRGEFIHVCGSEKQFEWLIQRQEAGRRGGLAKAKRQLAEPKRQLAEPKQNVPSYSSSFSYSSSKNINNINTAKVGPEELARKCLDAIQRYGPDDYDKLRTWVGEDLFNRVQRTGGWGSVRAMPRDGFTLMNLTKRLGS